MYSLTQIAVVLTALSTPAKPNHVYDTCHKSLKAPSGLDHPLPKPKPELYEAVCKSGLTHRIIGSFKKSVEIYGNSPHLQMNSPGELHLVVFPWLDFTKLSSLHAVGNAQLDEAEGQQAAVYLGSAGLTEPSWSFVSGFSPTAASFGVDRPK